MVSARGCLFGRSVRRTESFSRVMRTERNATGRIEALPPSALREGAFRVFGLPERKASPECSKGPKGRALP